MTKCLADVLDHLHFVVATYQFVGKDEDELSFNKGDIVVISKVVDGGWWEGTLDGKIGWFPSNYVKDISSDIESDIGNRQPKKSSSPRTDTVKSYHDQVLKNMVDTERAHGKDLQNFLEKYIEPLKKSTIMSPSQVNSLCGNYDNIVTFHQNLLSELEEEVEYSLEDQRIGACFLRNAMEMKNLYLDYCAGHPQAAELLSQFSEELNDFMEKEGAPSPGIMTLTTYLSKPFVHVEKYASQLKELERYIEEDHRDFLDIKKEAQVYQIIALSCNEVRKRKEMELEMLTGSIEGWEGEPITSLGRIILMSQVFLEKNSAERKERYFCLFPKDLVVLFVSPKLEGYCFEERIAIADLSGKDLEDTDDFFNAFELTVNDDVWKVMTSSPREKDCWVDALQRMLETRFITNEPPRPKVVVNLDRSDSKRGQVQSLPKCGAEPAEPIVRSYSTGSSGPVNRPSFRSRATGFSSSESTPAKSSVSGSRSLARGVSPFYPEVKEQPTRKNWSFTRLRPTPPYQPNFALKTGEDFISSPRTIRRLVTSKKNNKGPEVRSKSEDEVDAYPPKKESRTGLSDSTSILQEDMMILSVIEAYCFSAKQRQTMHCGSPTNIPLPPEVPPHFSFKPVTPPRPHRGKYKKSKKKKPSVDMSNEVSSLRDQVQNLQRQTLYLRENLEQERQARKRFEKLLRKTIRKIAPDVAWHEDPGKTTSV